MNKKELIYYLQFAGALLLIALLWWGSWYKLSYLKAQAGLHATRRNHTRIMDAIAVHRGDNRGQCPQMLEELLHEHLDKIPPAFGDDGGQSSRVINAPALAIDGRGGWLYVNDRADENYCKVFVNY